MTDKTRFEQEIRIQQQMRHSNIVQLIDLYKDTLNYYVLMEFCPNGELFSHIVAHKKLTEYEARMYFKQILEGLAYIHANNVAHRDLKPENILLDEDGRAKISDFGLSKFLGANGLTSTSCGSPCYAAPEVLMGQPYDPKKSDMWSCGVIFFAMVTGQLPWTKRNQHQLFNQIKKARFVIPTYISTKCSNFILSLMTLKIGQRLTAEQALHHDFMSEITPDAIPESIPKPIVSLRKLDNFFEKEDSLLLIRNTEVSVSTDNFMENGKNQKRLTFSKTTKLISQGHYASLPRQREFRLKPSNSTYNQVPECVKSLTFSPSPLEEVTQWKDVVKKVRNKHKANLVKPKVVQTGLPIL